MNVYVFLLYKTCIGCYSALRNREKIPRLELHLDTRIRVCTEEPPKAPAESPNRRRIAAYHWNPSWNPCCFRFFVRKMRITWQFRVFKNTWCCAFISFIGIVRFQPDRHISRMVRKISINVRHHFPRLHWLRWLQLVVPGAGLLQSCIVAFSNSRNLGCHRFILEMMPGEFLERLEWSWMIDVHDASWWFWHNLIYTAIACHSLVNQRSADHSPRNKIRTITRLSTLEILQCRWERAVQARHASNALESATLRNVDGSSFTTTIWNGDRSQKSSACTRRTHFAETSSLHILVRSNWAAVARKTGCLVLVRSNWAAVAQSRGSWSLEASTPTRQANEGDASRSTRSRSGDASAHMSTRTHRTWLNKAEQGWTRLKRSSVQYVWMIFLNDLNYWKHSNHIQIHANASVWSSKMMPCPLALIIFEARWVKAWRSTLNFWALHLCGQSQL